MAKFCKSRRHGFGAGDDVFEMICSLCSISDKLLSDGK